MNVILKTERLVLRPINEDDAHDFFELDSNPNVHRYLGNNPVTSIQQCEEIIQIILKQYKRVGLGRLAVELKDTSEFIGWAGLKLEQQLREDFEYYDVGYRLKEKYWGKGYATEAAKASLDFGFTNLGLPKICAAAETQNSASKNVLQKCGMILKYSFGHEGTLCHWYEKENQYN